MTEREALKLALEALEQLQGGCTDSDDGTVEAITVWCPEVIDAIKEALAQPEQKPFFTEANGFSQTFVPKDRQRQAIISLTEQCAALIQERDELQKQVWQYEKLAQPELCKYGQEPKSCTSSPMDCQCAIDATFAQPEQEVDWEKLYRLEVKKKEALAAKYERDIKPLTKIVPMTQPEQERTGSCPLNDCDGGPKTHGCWAHHCEWKAQPEQKPVAWRFRSGTWFNREAHWRYINTLEGTKGLRGLEPLYTTPPQRTWVGLTDEDKQIAFDDTQEGGGFWEFADAIEATLRKKNHG